MGHHCCSKLKVKRGLWSPEEDEKLILYITSHGHGCWSSVPKLAGLQRCGKSCRLRWINYLRPDLKRGTFTAEEERVIIDVHRILGNRWAQIAKHLPGRTDNEVKNFWNSCIKKKLMAQGLDPKTHNLFPATRPANNNNNINYLSSTSFSSQFNNHSHQPSATTVPFTISSNVNESSTDLLQQMTSTGFDRSHINPNVLMDYNNCSSCSFGHSDFLDEACMWDIGNDVGPPASHEASTKQQGIEQEGQYCQTTRGNHEINEGRGIQMEMSYNGNSPFDQLELLDSALMPCDVFSGGSLMEQLQYWDC